MSPKGIAAVGITLAAFAAPASAGAQDLRSPDARDTAPVVQAAQDLRSPDARSVGAPQSFTVATDMRSPDARVAGAPEAVPVGTDLRSPDTRDAGEGRGTFNAPDVMVVKLDEPAPAPLSTSDGLDWGDAGIGAAGMLALVLAGFGGAHALTTGPGRRRSTAHP